MRVTGRVTHQQPLEAVPQALEALLAHGRAEPTRLEQHRLPARPAPGATDRRDLLPVRRHRSGGRGPDRQPALPRRVVLSPTVHRARLARPAAHLLLFPHLHLPPALLRVLLLPGDLSRQCHPRRLAPRRGPRRADAVELPARKVVERPEGRERVRDGAGHGREGRLDEAGAVLISGGGREKQGRGSA